jgi:methylated-DNA-[protein]-cysteine S-methyltransferase
VEREGREWVHAGGDDPGAPSYVIVPSRFGPLVLVWRERGGIARVERLLLPQDNQPTEAMLAAMNGGGHRRSPAMQELAGALGRYLEGEDVAFSLDRLAIDACSDFQQRVLRAEHAIPRGRVSTYGRIAGHMGEAGAARAVGRALATNPFPILIPCHRAVRADGTLGGYRGGLPMKRALLEMEGVPVSPDGRVPVDRFYY